MRNTAVDITAEASPFFAAGMLAMGVVPRAGEAVARGGCSTCDAAAAAVAATAATAAGGVSAGAGGGTSQAVGNHGLP